MKILFSDNSLWSLLHFRGVVIKYFLEQGHQIVLVAPYEEIAASKQIAGVEIIYIKLDRTSSGIKSDLFYVKDLYRIYRQQAPDIIFQYTIKPSLYGSVVAKCLSIPTVCMFAGTGELFEKKWNVKYMIALSLMKLSLRFTKKLLLLNADDKNRLLNGNYIKSSKIILFNAGEGVDVEYYSPSVKYKPNHPRKFIMVGRLLYDKGYREYVEVAKKIRKRYNDVEFLMLGYLDTSHPLAVPRQIIMQDTKDGFINYLGTVEDVRTIVAGCDCFVLPSFYNEGMNRSLMEAISMAKPVISTDNKGCRDMVVNGINGYLVKPKNVESLYDAILAVCEISDKELLKMGQLSRKLAIERFSDKIVLKEYSTILNE